MGVSSFTLMRPSALLCISLVLLVFLFPDTCIAGKKGIPPVKHLFGVGIGYQKVVHYKPVLLISKSRRVKHRPSGWGWNGGGGSGRGGGAHKSYSPVVIQEHIHKPGKSGHAYGNAHPQHHRRKRKRPFHRLRSHSGSRGWGWRQGWRRPHRSYRKGYGGGGHQNPHDSHHHHHHGGSNEASYDYPHQDSHHHHHQEISEHPSSAHHDDYRGNVWGGAAVTGGGGGAIVYPSHSSNYYGSPYSSIDDHEDDHGGYESEIREQWKTDDVPTTPTTFSSTTTTTVQPTPPLYPFTDQPKNDATVTNIQRDFLKTHMNNFRQFQDYQQATTNQPNSDEQNGNQFAPFLRPPPDPYFSTNPQSSEASERENTNYDDEYQEEMRGRGDGAESYDDDYNGGTNNELNRKMMTLQGQNAQVVASTAQPTTLANSPMTSRNNFQQIITAMPKNDKKFKPSPRVEDMGSGNSFNRPGFFPSFEQFRQIKMT